MPLLCYFQLLSIYFQFTFFCLCKKLEQFLNALEIIIFLVYFTMFSLARNSGNVFETWENLTFIFIDFHYYARI
jgi:hypothetical protein